MIIEKPSLRHQRLRLKDLLYEVIYYRDLDFYVMTLFLYYIFIYVQQYYTLYQICIGEQSHITFNKIDHLERFLWKGVIVS